ncbi:DNA repair protein XRCC1 isoform 1-T2 [Glossina fuscipes fuscipes]
MPFALFNKVRECSSEDQVHVAANLIKGQAGKKWKTKLAGEKQAYVILEMKEAQQICGIDIGNEHSAFVEVLVGKTSCTSTDFTEILITCSFMTPVESKNSTNINRVRCFNQDALVPAVASSKWSLVKIVCTQPFNRHVQYGLAFIKVHLIDNSTEKNINSSKTLVPENFLMRRLSNENKLKSPADVISPSQIGKFKFREDSPDSGNEVASSLFKRWKTSKEVNGFGVETTAAAAIRKASNNIVNCQRQSIEGQKKASTTNLLDRNRDKLLFGDNDDDDGNVNEYEAEKKARLAKHLQIDKERRHLELQKREQESKSRRKCAEKNPITAITKVKEEAGKNHSTGPGNQGMKTKDIGRKRNSSPVSGPSKKSKFTTDEGIRYKAFNQLFDGIVLVISGIQNPDRAELRRKAVTLGAKYKADWDNTCTHLICAFINTPKYNQVKGRGRIVTRSWIEKCYDSKKYLPWRRFALDSTELTKPESDEEILDEALRPKCNTPGDNDCIASMAKQCGESNNTLALYDLEDQIASNKSLEKYYNSDSDTEDEIERIKQSSAPSITVVAKEERDVYDVTTDEEDYLHEKLKELDSTGFFNQSKFFICNNVASVDKIKLINIIEEYAGCVAHKLSDAQYVITNEAVATSHTFQGKIVRPLWVYECHDLKTKLPTQRYLL